MLLLYNKFIYFTICTNRKLLLLFYYYRMCFVTFPAAQFGLITTSMWSENGTQKFSDKLVPLLVVARFQAANHVLDQEGLITLVTKENGGEACSGV